MTTVDDGGENIEFKHLTYKVKTGILKRTEKTILDGISGTFRAGELSVIIGPSGSGKTTLLNVLSGLVQDHYEGTIRFDESSYKDIRNRSSYIMHNQMLHPVLTVREATNFAIRFKTGKTMTSVQQKWKCDVILKQLGLLDSADTITKNLSGGQRRRLSIAVELVDDPSILFLDEPITGLDSSASLQFVTYLSDLAKLGKTIICSIHAPSALMVQTFDQIYAMADGKCIYQGSSANIVPFLDELDLVCPASYNPADYLMEIATNQYGDLNQMLNEKIGNGLVEGYRRNELKLESRIKTTSVTESLKYKSTFAYQMALLIQRNWLLTKRNKSYLLTRFIVCIALALMTGFSLYGAGPFANHVIGSFKVIYSINCYLLYSSFFSLLVRFPMDQPILCSEYFNGWYSSFSYYLALTIVEVPVLIGNTIFFTVITYYITGQPMEQHRLLPIFLLGILTSFIAQALGLFASSIFSDIATSLVIGSYLIAGHILFSGSLILKKDAHHWLKWIFDICFMNRANEGMVLALFGYNRENLECEDVYCHFRDPKKFLELLGTPTNISFCPFFIILFVVHVFAYINVMMKLKRINNL